MVVMVTCNNCGYEYESKVLQTPDEETLTSEPREDIMENCLSRSQVIVDQTFIGNKFIAMVYRYKRVGGIDLLSLILKFVLERI